jgi:tRNA wybutosine-synthesizing protein 4
MDFKAKNFSYTSKTFGDFIDSIEKGEKLYLRSLSSENAKELPASLENDYPSIAADFHLPGKSRTDHLPQSTPVMKGGHANRGDRLPKVCSG